MDDEERTPPAKIRVTGLQEAQLHALIDLERHCAAMHHAVGIDETRLTPRGELDLIRLRDRHNVFVAEADHHPAGYLAWRDEPPGVAFLAVLNVAPDYQRFGIGATLLRELRHDAQRAGLQHVVAWCWQGASWAIAFLRALEFNPFDQPLPPDLARWHQLRSEAGQSIEPDQLLFWRKTENLGLRTLPGVPTPD